MALSICIQKITNWYGNNRSAPTGEPPHTQVGTVWNYRLVILHEFKEEINKKMDATGLQASDK